MEINDFRKLDAFTLKIIAVIAMTIDHVGVSILGGNTLCDLAGRLAFPIFSFLLVESFFYTRNRKKFMIRLAIFAVVSEVAFDLCLYHTFFYWEHQNVMFTLLIGFAFMYFAEKAKNYITVGAFAIVAIVVATLIRSDYTYLGIIIIIIFYIFRKNFKIKFIAFTLANCGLRLGTSQMYAVLSMILLYFYSGKPGKFKMKYFFYIFYPVHLAIIYLIYRWVC